MGKVWKIGEELSVGKVWGFGEGVGMKLEGTRVGKVWGWEEREDGEVWEMG